MMHYLDTQVPLVTDSYTPISHADLIGEIMTNMGSNTKMLIRQNQRGTVIAGSIWLDTDETHRPSVSFVNSYDKTKKLAMAGGLNTRVCMNGSVWGDVKVFRKHTGVIDLAGYVKSVTDEAMSHSKQFSATLESFKYQPLTKTEISSLIGCMLVEEKCLSLTETAQLMREIDKPSFILEGDLDTKYGFYQCLTHVLKKSNPSSYLDKLSKVTEMFYEQA